MKFWRLVSLASICSMGENGGGDGWGESFVLIKSSFQKKKVWLLDVQRFLQSIVTLD